jgi:acyl-CoA reductase-like NAD-dependent aldehyde dehydrogenase
MAVKARKRREEKPRAGSIGVINPTTGELFEQFRITTSRQVDAKVAKAREVFPTWSRTPIEERASYLRGFAKALRAHKEPYAATMTQEMGKIIRESLAEVEKCAWAAEYFAENAERFLQPEVVETDAQRSYIAFHPRGVLGSIMPWNFPMWQIVRFAIPALVAGNAAVIKPASSSPQSGLNLEEAFREAGLPDGVLQIVVGNASTGLALIHSKVDFVSLTGSVATGIKIASEAATELKKTVLELGGSDPFLVLEDADLDQAARGAVTGRFINNGQSCIAAKRFIVLDAVADEFVAKVAENVKRLKVGDPLDPSTDIGPLYAQSQREDIERQVKDALTKRAKLLVGGHRLPRPGWFYEPTVLGDVTTRMKVMQEETFGPVLPVLRVPDLEAAVRQANDTEFGLGASVWTANLDRADELAQRLEAGMVFFNGPVKSDPRMPFGGVKHSGVGRELSRYGLLEMVNIKSVEVFPPATQQASLVE